MNTLGSRIWGEESAKPRGRYRWRLGIPALALVLIALAGLLGTSQEAEATARPDFQMPFTCGESWHASTRGGHAALDWNAYPNDDGRNVVASADGVASVSWESVGGYRVEVEHGGGWKTIYAHLKADGRVSGVVSQGDVIGRVGDSGVVSAAHLHWEQVLNGTKQSTLYVDGAAVTAGTSYTAQDPAHVSKNCGSFNRSFESGSGGWNRSGGSNLTVYSNRHLNGVHVKANDGTHFAAFNKGSGGSIYTDVPRSGNPHGMAAEVMVRPQGRSTASGSLCIWGLGGGNSSRNNCTRYEASDHASWTPVTVNFDTNGQSFDKFRIEFYPDQGTTLLDSVQVRDNLLRAGSADTADFKSAWRVSNSANLTRYSRNESLGRVPADGTYLGAFNAAGTPGQRTVYQDIPVSGQRQDTVAAEVQVRAQDSAGATGSLCIWGLRSDGNNHNNCASYDVGNNEGYKTIRVVYDPVAAYDSLRLEFYPGTGTTFFDTAHASYSKLGNGSFDGDRQSRGWQRGGSVNFTLYSSGQLGSGQNATDGTVFAAFNRGGGGSVFYDITGPGIKSAPVQVTADVRSQGSTATGALCIWGLAPEGNFKSCHNYSAAKDDWSAINVTFDPPKPYRTLRVEFYPHQGTTLLDGVSVQ